MSPPNNDWLHDEIRAIRVQLDNISHEVSGMGSRVSVLETRVADARGGLRWFGGVVIALLSAVATWVLGNKTP